ncbi:MAG: virulence RhuM family protein [Planctomycetes bacterium]|nr:virulence RhuM family protein [Planctomycetota bacterium]
MRNVFKEGELDHLATVAKYATVQTEGDREVRREIEYYNLDAIISVGYRVNSKRGTQFRIWVTRVLRDHVLKGYTVNEARLRDLNRAVKLIEDTAKRRDLSGDEAKALLAVVGDYRRALGLLDDYDHQRVSKPAASGKVVYPLEYEEALRIMDRLRGEFAESTLFGVPLYPHTCLLAADAGSFS